MGAKKIMVQGTMSNSGKSFLTAALCRIFYQDGYRSAPFKSQNMALNSYITEDGLEMGRAQVMQAEAAGIIPTVDMNPILLKPTSHMGSQIIVRGEVAGNQSAMEYYRDKPSYIPCIMESFRRLEESYDIIVLEGAGSPAEINLKEHDIVNMGMARLADAAVILVGDIDRGGVFASLYGTVSLLDEDERRRIKGLVINKFRGDVKILEPGLAMIEELTGIPVLGVIPMESIDLDDEDSLSERLEYRSSEEGMLDIAVIRLPHISNFTDFNVLEQWRGVCVRYVSRSQELGIPDLIILPGSKNTMDDLKWLREGGLEGRILRLAEGDVAVMGICGGYQMLGKELRDPDEVESGGRMRGMALLDADTVFEPEKVRSRVTGTITGTVPHVLTAEPGENGRRGIAVAGYEIHMGKTENRGGCTEWIRLEDGRCGGLADRQRPVFGTYLHGIFDDGGITELLLHSLADKRGISLEAGPKSRDAYKEEQYDKLADLVRRSLDMEQIYRIMEQPEQGGSI